MSEPSGCAAKPRVLIDCDPGHDDAIMLVCAAVYADVVGITTVNGNVGLAHTTRNALAVTELLGWDVPVHAGAARPLLAEPVDAREVHGESGMDGTTLPTPDPGGGHRRRRLPASRPPARRRACGWSPPGR